MTETDCGTLCYSALSQDAAARTRKPGCKSLQELPLRPTITVRRIDVARRVTRSSGGFSVHDVFRRVSSRCAHGASVDRGCAGLGAAAHPQGPVGGPWVRLPVGPDDRTRAALAAVQRGGDRTRFRLRPAASAKSGQSVHSLYGVGQRQGSAAKEPAAPRARRPSVWNRRDADPPVRARRLP